MSAFVALFLSISLFVGQFASATIPFLHTIICPTSSGTETELPDSETETTTSSNNNSLGLTCGSALLMEASTGTIIYEKNATEQFRPASITKIMTLILIFDALS